MALPTPRPGIMEIKPYKPGSSAAPGAAEIFKLSSNESALGASPKALAAFETAKEKLFLYPDGASTALREKIAAVHGLDAARIVCGAGSDEILQVLTRCYAGEGDNIVQSDHGFLVYALAALSCGAEPRYAAEKNLTADVDSILARVDDRTRIVFIANPNNPTGTYAPFSEIRRLRENLREDVILVLDAAYAEYMEAPDYDAGESLVDEYSNVVVTRTFSKIYGLAGLRLGWGYCPAAIADVLNRVRGPFNVTLPAQVAGIAALEDQEFVKRNRDFNREERDVLQQQLGGMGLDFVPSHGNFVLVKFPDEPGKTAAEIRDHLTRGGVIVREMDPYGLGQYLRITVGPQRANRKLVELLAEKFARD